MIRTKLLSFSHFMCGKTCDTTYTSGRSSMSRSRSSPDGRNPMITAPPGVISSRQCCFYIVARRLLSARNVEHRLRKSYQGGGCFLVKYLLICACRPLLLRQKRCNIIMETGVELKCIYLAASVVSAPVHGVKLLTATSSFFIYIRLRNKLFEARARRRATL